MSSDGINLPPRGLTTRATRVAVAAAVAATAVAAATTTTAAAIAGGGSTTPAAAAAAVARVLWGATEATAATTKVALTNITACVGSTATATAASTTATAATEGRLTSDSLEEGRNLLVSLLQKVNKLAHDTPVSTVEERSRDTRVTSTTGTTDTVNIIVDVGGKVVVHNVGDVGNIKTTSSDGSCDQNGAAAVSEHLESTLTLTLGAVTVNGCGGELLVDEEVGQRVCHTLGLDENKCQTTSVGVQDVQQNRALVDILNVLDLLGNVLGSRTDTANREENVVPKEIAGKHLDIAGERSRKHECLAGIGARHVLALHNTSNLRLKTHIKHTISLVKDKVLDSLQGNAATLNEIDQTSWSGHQKITATLYLTKLAANVGTTVDDARPNPRTVCEFSGFLINLRDQLTSGCQNQRGRIGLAATAKGVRGLHVLNRTCLEGLGQDGEKETTSFARTSLSTGHQIAATHDNGNGVLLYRRGNLIASHRNVANQVVIQRRVGELQDRLGDIVTRGFNGNVVVLLKVDAGMLLGGVVGSAEELALDTGVGGASDVLALACLAVDLPAAVAGALRTAVACVAAAASAAARVITVAITAEAAATTTTAVAPVAAAAAVVATGGRTRTFPVRTTSTTSVVVAIAISKLVNISRGEAGLKTPCNAFLRSEIQSGIVLTCSTHCC